MMYIVHCTMLKFSPGKTVAAKTVANCKTSVNQFTKKKIRSKIVKFQFI